MDTKDYIGLPVQNLTNQLDKLNIRYKIIESSNIQRKFDTILVVKATQKDDYVEIVTDKFLLNI